VPPDPGMPLAEMAAQVTEMFTAYVNAGMPAWAVAVMLGTWMGTAGAAGQPGSDGA
jgi:hypothetical protein